MKGKILDFSVAQGGGLILSSDGTRYLFNADQWRGQSLPKAGQDVDFNIDDVKKAIEIYPDVFAVTQGSVGTTQTNYQGQSYDNYNYDNYRNLDKNSFWDYTIAFYTKNYANFQGRARRREYWGVNLIVNLIILPVDLSLFWAISEPSYRDSPGVLMFVILPWILIRIVNGISMIALTVRRLHDVDKSGWWYLIILVPFIGSIWLFILMCIEGTRGNNRFGADPKMLE